MKPKGLHVLPALLLLCLLYSCQKEVLPSTEESTEGISAAANQSSKSNFFYGPQVQIGNGKARSFFQLTHTGVPLQLGIELTAAALQGLPPSGENNYSLPFHPKVKNYTPFDHLEMGWNAGGHPPPGIYMVPHFDIHFYMISKEAQMQIPPYPLAAALFDLAPPAGQIPAPYFPGEGGVPQMGKHWIDPTSPEFNGQPFTKTFIYGSYNGKVIFYEPMITRAFLLTGLSSNTGIRLPTLFDPANTYYPRKYSITTTADGKVQIALNDFVWR